MKKFFFVLIAFLIYLLPSPALADEGWVIENFDSQINIQKDGKVLIDETIKVNFGYQSKHGIFRDIPYIYDSGGTPKYTEIQVLSVTQNNSPAKYKKSNINGYTELKIGDSNRTISGKNTYNIRYLATGILQSFPDQDELYWNVTGNSWPVPIALATAQVTMPENAIQKIACYQGPQGSTDNCLNSGQNGKMAQFSSSNLQSNEGLTIVLGYKKGLVPVLSVARPKTFWEKFTTWPSLTTLFMIIIFGAVTVFYIWYRYGRDYWFNGNLFGKKDEAGTPRPINGHETTVVEFTPPDKLRPAELGLVFDEVAQTRDVTATIIDLASRGFLGIKEIPKKWIFGSTDYQLTKKPKDTKELLSYESLLFEKIFNKKNEINISDLKTKFYQDLQEVKKELYKEVVAKKLFPSDPNAIRGKYLIIGILIIVLAGFAVFSGISIDNIFISDIGIGLFVSGILLVIFSKFMPRRTAYGRDIFRRTKGYYLFISTAEKYRQQFFEKKNLFNEVLPYAIMFGLTEKFAKAMKDIGLKPKEPDWYTGTHAFNSFVFANSLNDFSNSMTSAIATAPQSSGFGGGGSSGGGFGGGGGGSW